MIINTICCFHSVSVTTSPCHTQIPATISTITEVLQAIIFSAAIMSVNTVFIILVKPIKLFAEYSVIEERIDCTALCFQCKFS